MLTTIKTQIYFATQ